MVETHEVGDAVGLGDGDGEVIGREDGAVVGAVGAAELDWHRGLVVEVGEAGVGVQGARVEDALRRALDRRPLRRRRRGPWEGAVHYSM